MRMRMKIIMKNKGTVDMLSVLDISSWHNRVAQQHTSHDVFSSVAASNSTSIYLEIMSWYRKKYVIDINYLLFNKATIIYLYKMEFW